MQNMKLRNYQKKHEIAKDVNIQDIDIGHLVFSGKTPTAQETEAKLINSIPLN